MPEPNQTIEQVMEVKSRYEKMLLQQSNVIGVGVGYRQKAGQLTDELAIIVNVSQKQEPFSLTEEEILPTELEGVPVDVQEIGPMKAY